MDAQEGQVNDDKSTSPTQTLLNYSPVDPSTHKSMNLLQYINNPIEAAVDEIQKAANYELVHYQEHVWVQQVVCSNYL